VVWAKCNRSANSWFATTTGVVSSSRDVAPRLGEEFEKPMVAAEIRTSAPPFGGGDGTALTPTRVGAETDEVVDFIGPWRKGYVFVWNLREIVAPQIQI
jgi:hypothetical protein